MARLVIVSNRVPVPGQRGQAQAAGGLAVALHNAAHQRDCLWFGWSGEITSSETPLAPRITQAGRIAFATIGLAHADYHGYYRGFANGRHSGYRTS
jgi:trehalose 6-phosphate synthase